MGTRPNLVTDTLWGAAVDLGTDLGTVGAAVLSLADKIGSVGATDIQTQIDALDTRVGTLETPPATC